MQECVSECPVCTNAWSMIAGACNESLSMLQFCDQCLSQCLMLVGVSDSECSRCDSDINGVSAGKEKTERDNKSPSFRLTPERGREKGGGAERERGDQKMGMEVERRK